MELFRLRTECKLATTAIWQTEMAAVLFEESRLDTNDTLYPLLTISLTDTMDEEMVFLTQMKPATMETTVQGMAVAQHVLLKVDFIVSLI
jgi:hypothetical protein